MSPLDLLWNFLFYTRIVLRGIWCFMMIIIFVLAYFGMIVPMLPFKYIWPRLWWGFEGKLYRWMMGCVGYWGYTAGYDIIEFGDDLHECMQDRAVVMSNHQSTADVPALLLSLQQKGVACRKAMWIVAGMFKWSPFGVVGQVHGDYYIWEGRANKETDRLSKRLTEIFWARDRRWVILFPEGGFLYKRLEGSQRYAQKNGFPVLKNVTLPRLGAFQAILKAVGPRKNEETKSDTKTTAEKTSSATNLTLNSVGEPIKKNPSKIELIKDTVDAIRDKKYLKKTKPPVKYVVDITIGYKDGIALSADQLWFGTRRSCEDIHLYYKVYKASEVPFEDDDQLRTWMFDRFVEKEKLLEQFYATGEFMPGEYGRRLYFPLWKIMGQYLFWFAMAYAEFQVYSWALIKLFMCMMTLISPLARFLPGFMARWIQVDSETSAEHTEL